MMVAVPQDLPAATVVVPVEGKVSVAFTSVSMMRESRNGLVGDVSFTLVPSTTVRLTDVGASPAGATGVGVGTGAVGSLAAGGRFPDNDGIFGMPFFFTNM